jgi:hypothetical protein
LILSGDFCWQTCLLGAFFPGDFFPSEWGLVVRASTPGPAMKWTRQRLRTRWKVGKAGRSVMCVWRVCVKGAVNVGMARLVGLGGCCQVAGCVWWLGGRAGGKVRPMSPWALMNAHALAGTPNTFPTHPLPSQSPIHLPVTHAPSLCSPLAYPPPFLYPFPPCVRARFCETHATLCRKIFSLKRRPLRPQTAFIMI